MQIQIKMKCVSNNLDTFIFLKVNSSTTFCVSIWAGLVNASVFSTVHKDLPDFYYILEREPGIGNIKMTRI